MKIKNFGLRIGFGSLAMLGLTAADQPVIYPTYGVHNAPSDTPTCLNASCVYVRKPGEPTDPHYPPYWSSRWTMYRVFNGYPQNPPPYDGKPPASLKEGQDYQKSDGATYYDSAWRGPRGVGAMMEHYDKVCLPIFPMATSFTCSFISLGPIAYFVTYQDRPKGMPPVCLFSDVNHPPERDFIKHLPYSAGDSERLGGRIQGYSFWADSSGKPVQVGVSPVPAKALNQVMFGYAFYSRPEPDRVDKSAAPYRHPQSFYFSGQTTNPPNAPIVSQNYTDFAMIRPDPRLTWNQVSGLDPASLPRCQLFGPAGFMSAGPHGGTRPPTRHPLEAGVAHP